MRVGFIAFGVGRVTRDDELLGLMRDPGCQQALIGFEIPSRAGMSGIELKHNWKVRQSAYYKIAIEKIQRYGITLIGFFILGLDGDTPETFDDVLAFVRESALYDLQVNVMTAFPGTPLYQRLKAEGRIIRKRAWELCTLFDLNYRPKNMSVAELQNGFRELVKQLHSVEGTHARRSQFKLMLRILPNFGPRVVRQERSLVA